VRWSANWMKKGLRDEKSGGKTPIEKVPDSEPAEHVWKHGWASEKVVSGTKITLELIFHTNSLWRSVGSVFLFRFHPSVLINRFSDAQIATVVHITVKSGFSRHLCLNKRH
jgi:hypothetical protein